jgi:hypothetical protein
MHTGSTKKFGLHQPRATPLSRLSLVSYKLLYSSYHTASSCAPHVFDDLAVRPRFRGRGSDGFDGLNDEKYVACPLKYTFKPLRRALI